MLSYHVQQDIAEVYWDVDEYYVNNSAQEAGKFFREYQNHAVLGKTFPKDIPSHLARGLRAQIPWRLQGKNQFGFLVQHNR